MPELVTFSCDEVAPEIFFGCQGIVGGTARGQVRSCVRAFFGEGFQVVELEVVRFAAALAARVDVSAAAAVAPIHFASLGGGNVPTRLARWRLVRRFCAAPALKAPRIKLIDFDHLQRAIETRA